MNLYPQDLRPRHHRRLVARRDYASVQSQGGSGTPPASALDRPPALGRLARFWARGSGMTETQAAVGAPATANLTGLATGLPAILGPMISAIPAALAHKAGLGVAEAWLLWGALSSGVVATGMWPLGRAAFRSLHRAITVSEIEELRDEASDEVERAFLSLVADAVRIEMPDPPASELRNAILALAEAMERLPEIAPSAADPEALQREAAAVDARALAEPDPVIGDSLSRRADAIRRRADAASRSAQTGRRTEALRAEIEAQIAALHEGLAALSSDASPAMFSDLTHLAEAVRRVAADAVSTIDARAEVQTLSPTPAVENSEPARIQSRR